MKAIVKDVRKEVHPRDGGNTPVVVVEVDFVQDSGEVHSTSNYSFLPDELTDYSVFDRQAEVMQRDIEDLSARGKAQVTVQAVHGPVDDKIGDLRKHFKLSFGETIPIGDSIG